MQQGHLKEEAEVARLDVEREMMVVRRGSCSQVQAQTLSGAKR